MPGESAPWMRFRRNMRKLQNPADRRQILERSDRGLRCEVFRASRLVMGRRSAGTDSAKVCAERLVRGYVVPGSRKEGLPRFDRWQRKATLEKQFSNRTKRAKDWLAPGRIPADVSFLIGANRSMKNGAKSGSLRRQKGSDEFS
jgi:hypothetical protein